MYFDVSSGAFRAGALGNSPPGNFSIGMGVRTVATGEGAIALGNESKATGINSMAIGIYSEATGVNSICIGSGTAGGSGAVAIGNATSSGFYSVALGNVTLASGDYSTAMGNFTKAAGYAATAMGDYTRAIGTASTAMGDYTRAGGGSSTAMGNYTVANGYSGIAMGIYNDSIVSPQATVTQNTPLLIIGNGTDDLNRHNALVVRKNGHVGIGTNSPNAQLHIEGGIDAGFSDNSGYLIVGNEGATNIVFDDNEILARNNGTTSNLFLQSGGGRVIVGTSSGLTNSANIFDVNGTAGKPGGGTWATFSDERLKQDVKPYSEGLKNLLQINPVWFHYNSKSGYDTKPEYVEVLAQELQHAAPYMVTASPQKLNDGSAGYLQVDNSAMIYMLINAVKEQQQQIEGLKKQLGEKNDRQK
jgi:hypothetical protein